MTKDEVLAEALECMEAAIKSGDWRVDGACDPTMTIERMKRALEAKDEPWAPDDTAYRPNGLPQEFIKHEVESPEDWSEWVCPNPDEYFMKCCDCGLVHEVQYRVARYGEGDYCELVDDKDVQAQFRMRRRTPPKRKPLTDEEIDKAWRSVDYTVPWDQHRIDIARAIEAAHGIKGEA